MTGLKGVQLGDCHTLRDWGLYLVVGSPLIGGAEPEKYLVNIPGSDRLLDLSKALDGKVHYKQRKMTITLKCVRPAKFWPHIQRELENALQGQWLSCVFDEDPSWRWEGLWEVEPKSRTQWAETFTITGTCNPYKVNITAEKGGDWLWDTFNFEDDTIYTAKTEVKSL